MLSEEWPRLPPALLCPTSYILISKIPPRQAGAFARVHQLSCIFRTSSTDNLAYCAIFSTGVPDRIVRPIIPTREYADKQREEMSGSFIAKLFASHLRGWYTAT